MRQALLLIAVGLACLLYDESYESVILILVGLWRTRQTEDTDTDREMYVKTTLRELGIYLVFICVLCICKYCCCRIFSTKEVPFDLLTCQLIVNTVIKRTNKARLQNGTSAILVPMGDS